MIAPVRPPLRMMPPPRIVFSTLAGAYRAKTMRSAFPIAFTSRSTQYESVYAPAGRINSAEQTGLHDPPGLPICLVIFLSSEPLADRHTRCRRKPAQRAHDEPLDRTGERVGRKARRPDVAVYRRFHVLPEAPKKFAGEDRQKHGKIIRNAEASEPKREARPLPVPLCTNDKAEHDHPKVKKL